MPRRARDRLLLSHHRQDAAAPGVKRITARGRPTDLQYFTHHVASHQELHLYDLSTKAWNEALGTLPSEGLSAQEMQLKSQYQEGHRLSQEGLEARESRTMESNKLQAIPANVKPPWIIALEMEDVLTANNVLNSCVSALCPIPQARSHAST